MPVRRPDGGVPVGLPVGASPPCCARLPPGAEPAWPPLNGQERGRGQRGAPAHEGHPEDDRVTEGTPAPTSMRRTCAETCSAPGVVNEHGTVFGRVAAFAAAAAPLTVVLAAAPYCIPRILGLLYVANSLVLM